ncbi:MAG: PKD domain-containing protein, partial [Verrucomicrobiota bacterium]|nr:PKD domain-containing protein [Verrucomicrobiota bacterium]
TPAPPGSDLRSFQIAQPYDVGNVPKLIFTINTDPGQSPQPPGSSWYVAMKVGAGYKAVHMTWKASSPQTPVFESYTPSANQSGGVDGRFVTPGTEKPAETTSSYLPPYTQVVIVVKASDLGLSAGDVIGGFVSAVSQTTDAAGTGSGATALYDMMPDSLAYQGSYTVDNNQVCRPNTAPTAVLTGVPQTGQPPLLVHFSGAGSSDPDTTAPADTIANYHFDFGDGSAPVDQASPTIDHTYAASGDYPARLTVTDSRGKPSLNAAQVVVTVAVNTPPTAVLKATPTSGPAPLTVKFDATGSSDPDFGDTINSNTFSFGDGSSDVTTGSPVVNHTYAAAGTFAARLTVTDSRGAKSENTAQQVITVTKPGPTPTPSPSPTPTASPTPAPTPTPGGTATPTPTPGGTATPTPTPGATPTPTATPSPTPTPVPEPTPANLQLLNIAGRVFAEGGDKVGIGGFIVRGAGTKRVMVRAIGPSLKVDGNPVPGRMQDPTLELHDANGGVLSNDNWRSSQDAEIQQTGLAPSDDRESAIVKRLAAGVYTAIIKSADGSPGLGVVEIYDLEPTNGDELGNLSVRATVGTDDRVLIDGVILGGGAPKRIVFRALGPSVKVNGNSVPGTLSDPTLELHDGNGVLVRSNDNWKDAINSAEIQSSGLAPEDERESAILMPLSPGSYTSIVRGVNSTTGIGLAEAYKLDN